MRLRWTPAAAADLQHLSDYLEQHHPRFWQPTLRKLYEPLASRLGWCHTDFLK